MTDPLSPQDTLAMQMLAGAAPKFREVFAQVAARQPTSMAWQRRAYDTLTGSPSTLAFESPVLPLCVERAQGGRIWDVDGNEYIDCHMGYTAGILGHNPAPVAEAVQAALGRGLGGGHFFPEQVELAELVCAAVPNCDRVSLFHTGGEAIAAAVRFARAATGRRRIAKFEGCYHGSTEIGLHNTWMILSGRAPSDPLDDIKPQASTGGVKGAGDDDYLIVPFNSPVALERIRAEARTLSCIVVDPAPIFASPWLHEARRFIQELAALAEELELCLVFDEVVCGFRMAKGGAREWAGVTPAMSCFGKITSGLGIPLSFVAGRSQFLDTARTDGLFRDYGGAKVWVASTLSGSFLAVVAALAQLRHVLDNHEAIMTHLNGNRALLDTRLRDFGQRSGIPITLHGDAGLQMQLGFTAHEGGENSYRAMMQDASPAQFMSLMALTFYLRANGVYTKLIPTMNLSAGHTEADVHALADAIELSLTQMQTDGVLKV